MKIKQLAVNSMLAAMCACLGAVSLDMGNLKITLESVPILIGALLFGPIDALLIGTVGTFLYQVLRYGFTVTTPLWVLPYALCGFIVGQYAKKREFHLTIMQTVIITVLSGLVVTTVNTVSIYIDSIIFGYYSYAYVFGSVVVRYLVCIGKSVVCAFLLPPLVAVLQKYLQKTEVRKKVTIDQEKKLLREEIRAARQKMSREEKALADEKICGMIISMLEYEKAQCIFAFVGTDSETDTRPIILDALSKGKRVCVPLCTGRGLMEAKEIKSLDCLKPGSYGILEPPKETPTVHTREIDFSLVPCLGSDHSGHRLGNGGGYYDRFLSSCTGAMVLVCYESLTRPYIPTQPHDVIIKTVVTEKGIFKTKV